MAKKGMDIRGQIADLREILQVQSLKIEKQLHQTEKNMENIRDKVNHLQSSIDWIIRDLNMQQDTNKRQLKIEGAHDNDIQLLFQHYAELTRRQDGVEKSMAALYDELKENDIL